MKSGYLNFFHSRNIFSLGSLNILFIIQCSVLRTPLILPFLTDFFKAPQNKTSHSAWGSFEGTYRKWFETNYKAS